MPALLERHQELLDLLVTSGRAAILRPCLITGEDVELNERALWWVRRGCVRRYREAARRVLVDVHGPGAVVGHDGAGVGEDPEALVATGGTELVAFSLSCLAEIARLHPEATTMLVAGLAHHQSVLRRRLYVQRGGDRGSRLLNMLQILGREIGMPCGHGRPGWIDVASLTHQDLADLHGCTRPHVTGKLNALVAEGVIAKPRGRVICVRTPARPAAMSARS
jgi:CRP-like cAMP-binding protein